MTGRPRTAQELIHWLEAGGGARWVLLASLLSCSLVVSVVVSWRQFHGAASESTLVQADIGRSLAYGRGFSTKVIYPQAEAYLAGRGVRFDAAVAYPDVYQAPLYPLAIAAAIDAARLLPGPIRPDLFGPAPAPPYGFAADYLLLALNVGLFWATVLLGFLLGRALFGVPAGWLSAAAIFVSLPLWQQVVAVNGSALMMALSMAAFLAWWHAEMSGSPRGSAAAFAVLGALCGALFLTEYSAGVLVLVAGGACALERRPGRALRIGLVAAGFAVVALPWVIREVAVTGLPTGLALQNVALKAGDTTAEPSTCRATLSAALPQLDLTKLANKVLTSVQGALRSGIWSDGAMWFAALFATGCLYVFRSPQVNRLRWILAVSVAALALAQAAFNSGESERQALVWMAPLIIVFGAGFFHVLLASNPSLSSWPRLCAAVLVALQAGPLVHDALEPHWLHFQYPPYFPQLLQGMRSQLARADPDSRYGLMADIPAGLAWYGNTRVWAQPATLRDFYAVQVEQPTGELLLTPRTLDRPFFTDLSAKSAASGFLTASMPKFGDWGEVYGGLLTGNFPSQFPLPVSRKVTEDLVVLINGSLIGPR
ncbi:MAG TPA: hypothetical protein VGG34_09245 [Opitutaceae bacterium]|jgi:hypothetical protein